MPAASSLLLPPCECLQLPWRRQQKDRFTAPSEPRAAGSRFIYATAPPHLGEHSSLQLLTRLQRISRPFLVAQAHLSCSGDHRFCFVWQLLPLKLDFHQTVVSDQTQQCLRRSILCIDWVGTQQQCTSSKVWKSKWRSRSFIVLSSSYYSNQNKSLWIQKRVLKTRIWEVLRFNGEF